MDFCCCCFVFVQRGITYFYANRNDGAGALELIQERGAVGWSSVLEYMRGEVSPWRVAVRLEHGTLIHNNRKEDRICD